MMKKLQTLMFITAMAHLVVATQGASLERFVLIDGAVYKEADVPEEYNSYVSANINNPRFCREFLVNHYSPDETIDTLAFLVFNKYGVSEQVLVASPCCLTEGSKSRDCAATRGSVTFVEFVEKECSFFVTHECEDHSSAVLWDACNSDSVAILCSEESPCSSDLAIMFIGDDFAILGCGGSLDFIFLVFPETQESMDLCQVQFAPMSEDVFRCGIRLRRADDRGSSVFLNISQATIGSLKPESSDD